MGVLRTLLWWQNANVVGKVDTTTNTFSTIGPLTDVTATTYRFAGATAVGTIVFFAPYVSLATLALRRVCMPVQLARCGLRERACAPHLGI